MVALVASSVALGADYKQVMETMGFVERSVRAEVGSISSGGDSFTAAYLPSYGLSFQVRKFYGNPAADMTRNLSTVLTALAPTVRGLDPAEWVSVGLSSTSPKYVLLVRVRPASPTAVEVWLDGVKQ